MGDREKMRWMTWRQRLERKWEERNTLEDLAVRLMLLAVLYIIINTII